MTVAPAPRTQPRGLQRKHQKRGANLRSSLQAGNCGSVFARRDFLGRYSDVVGEGVCVHGGGQVGLIGALLVRAVDSFGGERWLLGFEFGGCFLVNFWWLTNALSSSRRRLHLYSMP